MKARLVLLGAVCLGVLALAPFLGPDLGSRDDFALLQLRLPRAIMAALVGGSLSLVGACYQTLFANPLAEPGTIGTTAGAALGATFAVVLGLALPSEDLPSIVIFSFAGALLVTLGLSAISASGRAGTSGVLLAGIAFTLMAGAVSTGLQFTADQRAVVSAVRWSLGSLVVVGYREVVLVACFTLPCTALLLSRTHALESLATGEDRAFSQGLDVARERTLILACGALCVAASVAWCGPISFVGLIVPHLARLTLGASRRVLLPGSVLLGAAFLTLCDTAARLILEGRLPVGVITAALGAPMLVWLIARRARM